MEEAVAADRKVDERGLDRRLEVDDLPLVDIARVTFVTGAFDVQLFEDAVFNNRDTAFLGLKNVDQHFFFHAVSFRD
jgi:hypothetical protein